MRMIGMVLLILALPVFVLAQTGSSGVSGRVLLAVEDHGKTWYVSPTTDTRYFFDDASDVQQMIKTLALGISNADLAKIPTTDESATGDLALRGRLSGRLLLAVEDAGRVWYVRPTDLRRIELGRADNALRVLQSKALGITSKALLMIPITGSSDSRKAPVYSFDVPFVAQSPWGQWSDPREKDGCEEAVSLMAVAWARGETLSRATAQAQIHALADWEVAQFGYHEDTGAQDTADRLIRNYLGYDAVDVQFDVTTTDLINTLADGNIAIIPIDGRKIGSPHYRNGGPARHMIVIVGYDTSTDEFVVHDPGTIYGESYRYSSAAVASAMRDYPSGVHLDVPQQRTAMIAIRPSSTLP